MQDAATVEKMWKKHTPANNTATGSNISGLPSTPLLA